VWCASLVAGLLLTSVAIAPAAAQDAPAEEPVAALNPAEPDFTLINLPTSLRVPRFKSAFRVTHRFTRPLGVGDFGDLVSDFFGLDSGAQIGLEFRFGLMDDAQIGVHRTNDKTIEFFGQYDVVRQGTFPLGVAVLATIDGTNNFKDSYSPALGAILTRIISRWAAVYFEPTWVNNTNALPSELTDHNSTFLLNVGGRVRIRPTVYVVAEWSPRVAGHDPGAHQGGFAIEKRAGGHLFQLNFTNSFGTTMGDIARGGLSSEDWYLGFNISRKFF
jgi:hypothetical protein